MTRLRQFAVCAAFVLGAMSSFSATTGSLTKAAPPAMTPEPTPEKLAPMPMLSDLLTSKALASFSGDAFFEEIPANLERAVSFVSDENFTSATEALETLLAAEKGTRERARIRMWLFLARGIDALTYANRSHDSAAAAFKALEEAKACDPGVMNAPDVVRVFGEMTALGWNPEFRDQPDQALKRHEEEAERSRRAIDFYKAGCIQRKMSERSWSYSDTTPQDQRAVQLFARAVACNPEVYECWTAYLPSLAPVGLHDLMSSESTRMEAHFRKLRCPLVMDQGPVALHFKYRTSPSMQADEDYLAGVIRETPDDPYPYYQLALFAIETTPSLAVKRFEEFLANVESGKIRLRPREHGYLPSAHYKLAFLSERERGAAEALRGFEKVTSISPHYAQANGNIAQLCMQLAAGEKDAAVRNRWIERGVRAANAQMQFDYRGQAAQQAEKLKYQMLALKDDSATSAPR